LTFGEKKMAVFSIVKLSELEGAKRIDAEYYDPVFYSLEALNKFEVRKLNAISDIAYGTTPPGGKFEERGVPFVRSQNFILGMINRADIVYCDANFHEQNKKSAIRPGDILFAAVGATIGQVAIVQDSIKEGNINQNIARVRILDSSTNPYYVGLFFLSKYGQLQIFRFVTGNAQAYLNSFQIGSFKIPVLSKQIQDELGLCFKKVEDFVENSYSLYSQAETLLLEELGLKDFKPKYEKTYTAKLSDAFSAHRIDAEYFQPAYEEVVRKIKEYPNGFSKLLKHVENIKPNFDPTKYPDEDFCYVELADIDSSIGIIHSVNKVKGGEAPSRARRLLKEGDVIVSSVEGSLEKVALVDKEHNGCLASTGFFQFRPLDILPEVLLVLSKTIVLQSQLKKKCSGTILTAVPKESLRDIIIPLLSFSSQQEIASLVQQSHEARKKAKELLELAKRAVEIAIEEGEEKAINFLSRIK